MGKKEELINNTINMELDTLLNEFGSSSLDDINKLDLLNRYDTKLLTNTDKIPYVLDLFKQHHTILQIGNRRIFNYSSCYFDTADFLFYLLHHNGHRNRLKIRNRKYIDSGTCFLEIKQKSSSSLTFKNRINVNWHDMEIPSESNNFIRETADIEPNLLERKLTVDYKRITLLNESLREKITIDIDIRFKTQDGIMPIPDLSIIELKTKAFSSGKQSLDMLKSLNIKPLGGFSKYCMGLVLTNQAIKYNRFKSQLLSLNKTIGN